MATSSKTYIVDHNDVTEETETAADVQDVKPRSRTRCTIVCIAFLLFIIFSLAITYTGTKTIMTQEMSKIFFDDEGAPSLVGILLHAILFALIFWIILSC